MTEIQKVATEAGGHAAYWRMWADISQLPVSRTDHREHHRAYCDAVAEAVLHAALPLIDPPKPVIKVKPLKWADGQYSYCLTSEGYDIVDNGAHWGEDRYQLALHSRPISNHATWAAAEAAAQAHHERRILSAIETAPPPVDDSKQACGCRQAASPAAEHAQTDMPKWKG